MRSFINVVTKITEYVMITLGFLMVALVFGQVIMRHVTHSTPFYAEELSRYFLIWTGFLGASLGVRYGSHTAVSLFIDRLPSGLRTVVEKIGAVIIFLFLFIFLLSAVRYCSQQDGQISSTLKVSMLWPALAAPVGVFLMIIQLIGVKFNKADPNSGQEKVKEVI